MKPDIAIVGCGRVGSALAQFLSLCGYRLVGAASRSRASAEQTVRWSDAARISDRPWEVTRAAGVVLITTPDGSIEKVCEAISRQNGYAAGAVVLHCSGALPSSVLSSARQCRAAIGSMHPLQSFASRTFDANPFKGVVISAEGDAKAVETARTMAGDLEGRCFTIKTEAKTLYHASAVVASNYLVTLLDLSFGLLDAAGIPRADAMAVLDPLIRGTLANINEKGTAAALTGPIARGDLETVADHLSAIEALVPEWLPIYRALGRHTVGVALAGEHITDAAAGRLKKLLG